MTATLTVLPSASFKVYAYHGASGQSLLGSVWLGFGKSTAPLGPSAVSLPSFRVRTQKPLKAHWDRVRSSLGVSRYCRSRTFALVPALTAACIRSTSIVAPSATQAFSAVKEAVFPLAR